MFDIGEFILNITFVFVSIWIVNKYLSSFFVRVKTNSIGLLSWMVFGGYQLFLEFHKGQASILNTVISIICVTIISVYNFEKAGKVKILYVIMLHVIWAITEMLLYFGLDPLFDNEEEFVILGSVISKMILSVLVYIWFHYRKRVNDVKNISLSLYSSMLFISIGSIYIAAREFFRNIDEKHIMPSMITFSILLLINILIFELYSKLEKNFVLQKENTVYAQQVSIMSHYTEEQKRIMGQFHEEKHNQINKLIVLKDSIEQNRIDQAIDELNRIIQSYNFDSSKFRSGNATVDALINFKYAIAKEKNIDFNVKMFIPEDLPINSCDLGVVIGNALDNAIEAAQQCTQCKRVINILMGIKKEMWIMVVKNPFEHELHTDRNGNYLSTKESEQHGYGLNSIRKVAEKYDGELLTEDEGAIFVVTVTMSIGKFNS